MHKSLTWITLLIATTASAQTPIPRQGNSCPTGTYKSGDYCKPFKSSEDKVIIQKIWQQVPHWILFSRELLQAYQQFRQGSPAQGGWR